MPHISSKKLKKEYLQKLYKELGRALQKSAHKSKLGFFMQDFFTPTEKVMLAKRFAVIYMLSKDIPVTYIAETLNMSPATVQRMSLKSEIGKYKNIIQILENRTTVWKTMEKILRAGLPPRTGRGRWKFLYK